MADKEAKTGAKTETETKLPLLYKELVPLSAERHGDYGVTGERSYAFAAETGFAPITMDEFAAAQRFYPIVFTREAPATPVVLFSGQRGVNHFVSEDGTWRDGAYIPGYLRRYPFHFVRRAAGEEERILCADTSSDLLQEKADDAERALFKDGAAGPAGERALEFCKAYEITTERTRRAVQELEELDLFQDSAIEVSNGENKARIDGFRIISEQKLREVDDETLAKLAKRGTLGPVYAHLFSLSNFTTMSRK